MRSPPSPLARSALNQAYCADVLPHGTCRQRCTAPGSRQAQRARSVRVQVPRWTGAACRAAGQGRTGVIKRRCRCLLSCPKRRQLLAPEPGCPSLPPCPCRAAHIVIQGHDVRRPGNIHRVIGRAGPVRLLVHKLPAARNRWPQRGQAQGLQQPLLFSCPSAPRPLDV